MNVRLLTASVVVGSLLGVPNIAGADRKSITDSQTDATPNSADIISARVDHTDDGKLRHTVKFDAPVDGSGEGQILLQFNLDADRSCEREFIWPPSGDTDMIRCGIGPSDRSGTISKPRPNTLRFVFRKSALSSPDRYGWRVITKKCGGKCPLIDAAPNQNGDNPVYVRHNL